MHVVVSKDKAFEKFEQEIESYKQENDRLRTLMEEDRITMKGLDERYMRVKEEADAEGLHLDGVTVKDGKWQSEHEKMKRKQLMKILPEEHNPYSLKAQLLWAEEQQQQLE